MKKFGELLSNVKILTALEKEGFTEPTEIQEKSIPVILSGADMLGKSRTGSGKTFAFGLPIIEKIDIETDKVQALIVCPTRELARQVTLELRKVANACDRIKIVPIYGGEDMAKQIAALKSAKIVVGTPGRIMDHLGRRTLKLDCLKVTVLDEADEMLNMGFRDDIEAIMKACPKYRQNIMFSATMPKPIAELTSLYLKDPVTVEIGAGLSTVEKIQQRYVVCKANDKIKKLTDILRAVDTEKCLIFCNTKRMVEQLQTSLLESKINIKALHGDMRQSERRRVMTAVKSFDGAMLVATDVAARGIDINDIEYVINFDVPNDAEYYVHRIGRTARAGKSGISVTLVNTRMQLEALLDYVRKSNSEITEYTVSDGEFKAGKSDGLSSGKNKTDKIKEQLLKAKAEGDIDRAEELSEEIEKSKNDLDSKKITAVSDKIISNLSRGGVSKNAKAVYDVLKDSGFDTEQLLLSAIDVLKSSMGRGQDRGAGRGSAGGRNIYKSQLYSKPRNEKEGGYSVSEKSADSFQKYRKPKDEKGGYPGFEKSAGGFNKGYKSKNEKSGGFSKFDNIDGGFHKSKTAKKQYDGGGKKGKR